MAKIEQKTIREAPLTNNCPECFGQDLILRFYQKHLNGPLYHRVTSEISKELKCNTCGTVLYPVTWTEDIERSVAYYQKAVQAAPARIRIRPLLLILILVGVLLFGALVYFYLQGAI